jgi:predicted nucleic acid-binding protein
MKNTTAFQPEVADLLIGAIALVLALLLWSRVFAAAVC